MFSMLAMQLFCTLLHASRMYSQKLRCPSELNQLADPEPREPDSSETPPSHNSPFWKHAAMATVRSRECKNMSWCGAACSRAGPGVALLRGCVCGTFEAVAQDLL